ncbi:restriction endonuclease subunit S [Campylobacter sp. IFREMER_LSEM_CL292]|uniref:restriction endonuclease subunit S n=1 Tax=Campylobacter sp. IFREMER_LSEM_CL292 TaxID=2911623 RepID=UPI0021E8472A|nr:restriction endonuclease subunit S [Campylobacter sp. IFREMER_LSEM_CL292]MCV3382610.1 restriction endonuclease subunit S [Campylobacter sp. IFREMER_LSEM_CL292]
MKNFKDSGIEWLGEIPEHWEIKPLKAVFNQRNEQNTNLKLHTILSLIKDIGVVPYEEKGNIGNKSKEDLQSYKIARINDLVLNKMNAVIGSLGVSAYNGLVSPIYLVFYINSPKYLMSYYSYLFQIKNVQKFLKIYAYGIMEIRESIDYLDFKKMSLPVPPPKEQEQIANFLDEKCEKIKNFIEKKEKLINLLKEQKQVLINETITKGLDKNVNFKDSGIEYLGEIPEHWEIRKLKYIISDKLTYGANETAELSIKEYPRYIRITDFDENGFLKNDTFKSLPLEIAKNFLLNEGDILFARSGATVGKTFHFKNYQGMACYAGYLIKASINQKIALSDYIFYYTKSYYYIQWKELILNKATIENIGADKYSELKISLPPLKEQEQITNFLDEKCEKIDLLIEKTEKQIKLIKEYKTTLINQAVCGRINL